VYPYHKTFPLAFMEQRTLMSMKLHIQYAFNVDVNVLKVVDSSKVINRVWRVVRGWVVGSNCVTPLEIFVIFF
jgi:hypothetical protein